MTHWGLFLGVYAFFAMWIYVDCWMACTHEMVSWPEGKRLFFLLTCPISALLSLFMGEER